MPDFDESFDPTSEPQGPPAPQPPDVEPWDNASDIRLSTLNSALQTVNQQQESSYLAPYDADRVRSQIVPERTRLLQRKQAAEAMQKQQAVRDAHESEAVAQSIKLQNAKAESDAFPQLAKHIVEPFSGKTATFVPKGYEQVDFDTGDPVGDTETGDPGSEDAPHSEAPPEPQTHTLTINGQDFHYAKGPQGWQQTGGFGSPTQAEIDAQHQYEQTGGYVDPQLAQRAMLDRSARAQGAVLPPGRPSDAHAEAKAAAGSLSQSELAQNRAKAAMALSQTGLRPGSVAYGKAMEHQVAIFNHASLQQKQHAEDFGAKSTEAQRREEARTTEAQRKEQAIAESKHKSDTWLKFREQARKELSVKDAAAPTHEQITERAKQLQDEHDKATGLGKPEAPPSQPQADPKFKQLMDTLTGPQQTPAPVSPDVLEKPSSVGADKVAELHGIASEAKSNLGWFSGQHGVLGPLKTILADAKDDKRPLTIAERRDYERYLERVADPELKKKLSLK